MAQKVRVILFGAGLIGRQVLPKLGKHVEVLAFSDNDPGKHDTAIAGVRVISPSRICEFSYDVVLITSTAIRDIYEQLLAMGIAREQIVIAGDAEASVSAEFPWDAVLFLALGFALVAATSWLALQYLGG